MAPIPNSAPIQHERMQRCQDVTGGQTPVHARPLLALEFI
jgi:hypothetical protein